MATDLIEQPIAKPQILYSVTAETIAQMKTRFASLTINGVNDKAGYDAVHKARMECVRARTAIEKTRKDLNAESQEFIRKVNAEAKTLTSLITDGMEKRLEDQQQAVDNEKARLKQVEEDKLYAERQAAWDAAGGPKTDRAYLLSHNADQFAARLTQQIEAKRLRDQAEAERVERDRLASTLLDRIGKVSPYARSPIVSEVLRDMTPAQFAEHLAVLIHEDAAIKASEAAERDRLAEERRALDAQREEQAAREAELQAEADRLAQLEADRVAAAQAEQDRIDQLELDRQAADAAKAREEELAADHAAEALRLETLRPVIDRVNEFADKVELLAIPDVPEEFASKIQDALAQCANTIRNISNKIGLS